MGDLRLQFSDVQRCSKCGCTLLTACFAKDHKHIRGLSTWCRRCMQTYRKEYRKTRREQMYTYFMKHNYGLTKTQRDDMELQCSGLCMLCGKPETRTNQYGVRKLCVDHNHLTKRIRGLLCATCNQAIGLLYVDECGIELLQKAIAYIEAGDVRP